MMMLALIILAAMAPVFLMMWFDDIEARQSLKQTGYNSERATDAACEGCCNRGEK